MFFPTGGATGGVEDDGGAIGDKDILVDTQKGKNKIIFLWSAWEEKNEALIAKETRRKLAREEPKELQTKDFLNIIDEKDEYQRSVGNSGGHEHIHAKSSGDRRASVYEEEQELQIEVMKK